ncbi:MAG: glycosyltransferase family 4 protein [Candidatus Eremiobacteraeota bacterium]|nr:glycosyltransferase family 4 protein [Candidatus Eremiobacteraeota bacterium]
MARFLQINDFAGSQGGAELHMALLSELLEAKGHEVILFPVRELYRKLSTKGLREKLEGILSSPGIDVAHVHMLDHPFLHLLEALYARGVPIIQTLHDHRPICPAGSLFRKGKLCPRCKGGAFYQAGFSACVNMPLALSLWARLTIMGQSPYGCVAKFIAPSRALIDTYRKWGFYYPMVHLANFLDMPSYEPYYRDDSRKVAYFGRLSPVKGINTLMEAVKGLPVELHIIGRGELEGALERKIRSGGFDNVVLRGYLSGDRLREAVNEAFCVVVPSECVENLPYAVMEAFALGKPVIGTMMGGIPELVEDGTRGFLFPAGDTAALREKIEILFRDRDKALAMGHQARQFAEESFSPDRYYHAFMELVKGVLRVPGVP